MPLGQPWLRCRRVAWLWGCPEAQVLSLQSRLRPAEAPLVGSAVAPQDGRMLAPAFLAAASWLQNAAVSQAEPASTALFLLRHSKRLHQPLQASGKSPCQLLERPHVVQPLSRREAPLGFKTGLDPSWGAEQPFASGRSTRKGKERKTQGMPFLCLQRASAGWHRHRQPSCPLAASPAGRRADGRQGSVEPLRSRITGAGGDEVQLGAW